MHQVEKYEDVYAPVYGHSVAGAIPLRKLFGSAELAWSTCQHEPDFVGVAKIEMIMIVKDLILKQDLMDRVRIYTEKKK